jgi:hypothetical protein
VVARLGCNPRPIFSSTSGSLSMRLSISRSLVLLNGQFAGLGQ